MKLFGRRPAAPVVSVTCGCCGQARPRTGVHELGNTPGVFVCWRCSVWMTTRIARRRGQARP